MTEDPMAYLREPYRSSDVRFELPARSFDFSDMLTDSLAAMRSVQLLDRRTWATLAGVFHNQGCDDEHAAWRCEYWGKMMRGACFTYKCAPKHDDELYRVLEETVRDLLSAQDELGRITTYTVPNEFRGWDIWGRKYVMLGLLYFLDICRDSALAEDIMTALTRHADYLLEKLGRAEEGKRVIAACTNNWDGLNSCSILEPFMLLYNRTHEQRYLDFAEYIISFGGTLHTNLFDLAFDDTTPIHDYPETKAYEMISCFEGLAEYVKVTHNERYRQALLRFGERVLREEATIIGCLGCQFESFDHAVVEQFNEAHTGVMQETCVTVTWMKFLWQLWRMTGNVQFIDALEVAAYNAMEAARRRHIDKEANSGVPIPIHSYNPLRHEVRFAEVGGRQYIEPDLYYGCCVCISTAGFALNTLAAAGVDKDGALYLNLFRQGVITSPKLSVAVDTDCPNSGRVALLVKKCDGQQRLYVRLPAWADRTVVLRQDGAESTLTSSDGYVCFTVTEGMRLSLEFPHTVRYLHPADVSDVPTDVTHYTAVQYGPVIYALDDCAEAEPVIPLAETGNYRWALAGRSDVPDPVPCRAVLTLPLKDGGEITLVDYPSAGQEDGHKVSAWIRTKETALS